MICSANWKDSTLHYAFNGCRFEGRYRLSMGLYGLATNRVRLLNGSAPHYFVR